MAAPAFEIPKLKEISVVPSVQEGSMAHIKSFVASSPIQQAIGFSR